MTESNTSVYWSKCSNPTSAMYKVAVLPNAQHILLKRLLEKITELC